MAPQLLVLSSGFVQPRLVCGLRKFHELPPRAAGARLLLSAHSCLGNVDIPTFVNNPSRSIRRRALTSCRARNQDLPASPFEYTSSYKELFREDRSPDQPGCITLQRQPERPEGTAKEALCYESVVFKLTKASQPVPTNSSSAVAQQLSRSPGSENGGAASPSGAQVSSTVTSYLVATISEVFALEMMGFKLTYPLNSDNGHFVPVEGFHGFYLNTGKPVLSGSELDVASGKAITQVRKQNRFMAKEGEPVEVLMSITWNHDNIRALVYIAQSDKLCKALEFDVKPSPEDGADVSGSNQSLASDPWHQKPSSALEAKLPGSGLDVLYLVVDTRKEGQALTMCRTGEPEFERRLAKLRRNLL